MFSTISSKAQNILPDSSATTIPTNAVIYVSEGSTIYDTEKAFQGEIVLLENKSKKNKEENLIAKSSKPKKEKLLKAVSKEPKKYPKIKSDEAIYDPLSPESSSYINHSKNSNSVAPSNNLQHFSKFQNPAVFSLLLKKKFVSQKTIFSYSQKRNLHHFSEIFSVRPPPIS